MHSLTCPDALQVSNPHFTSRMLRARDDDGANYKMTQGISFLLSAVEVFQAKVQCGLISFQDECVWLWSIRLKQKMIPRRNSEIFFKFDFVPYQRSLQMFVISVINLVNIQSFFIRFVEESRVNIDTRLFTEMFSAIRRVG